jgi:NADH-quinone oxidoreductase subunit N
MLFGMSLIYGLTGGETRLDAVAAALGELDPSQEAMALASIFFVVVGFAFKVSAFPFQFWAPDTYEGAPVPVAAFLAVASKAAGFAGLLQLMFVAFIGQYEFWVPIFAFLSIATMTIGNLVALQQRQFVRLLAYSGIAQAGYMLLPFALVTNDQAVNQQAFASATGYILIYGIMNLGAFAVAVALSKRSPRLLISDFAGVARVAPFLAVGMTLFMVSLAGVPPAAGFWAKILIFGAAIARGDVIGPVLAAIMVVNSVISVFYYLAVARQMFQPAEDTTPLRTPVLVAGAVGLSMAALLFFFLVPGTFSKLADISTLVG